MAGSPRILVEQYPIVTGSRRAHGRQRQASGGAEQAPSLTAVLRATAMDMCGRDEKMLPAGVERKIGTEKAKKGREGRAALKLG